MKNRFKKFNQRATGEETANRNAIWQKTAIALSAVLLLLILPGLAWSGDTYQNRSISGTVIRDIDRQEVQGAEIVAVATDDETCGGFAYSGFDGKYRIDQLRPGNYVLRVLASGYPGPATQQVTVEQSADLSGVDFALNTDQPPSPAPQTLTMADRAQISGTITRESDGTPLWKAGVALENAEGDTVAFTLTDSNGGYVLPNIVPGRYVLRMDASNIDSMLVSNVLNINLKRGQSRVINIAIRKFSTIQDPPCVFQGTVIDSRSLKPIPGLIVSDKRARIADTTDSQGWFTLIDVPYGSRDFVFSKDGYITNFRQEILIPGEAKTASLSMVPVADFKTVGPAGGVIEGSNGASITIPPGAVSKNTDISLTMLPMMDYFVGYNTMDLVDGFKILPDGITFQQPILVTLPLLEWQPAETLIPVSIFHPQSLEISPPLSAKVTDDGRYIVFPLTRVDSYGITQRNCRWVMVQGSNFTYTTNEVRERSSQYCQNRQKWTRDVSHRLRINVNTSISLKVDKVDLSTQYYFNWHHLITCESDYCRRHYVQAVASATITGFVEICVDQQASAKMDWLDLIWLSEKRVRITSATYQVGAGQDIEACCDGENCESDDNLCTRDICQDGECVHPDNEKGIACKSACKECDPRTGSCLRYKCKECEKCERAEPPIYGKCTPECITPADCPEPPDPCYRAICRSDGCCDKERVGDPPCDE